MAGLSCAKKLSFAFSCAYIKLWRLQVHDAFPDRFAFCCVFVVAILAIVIEWYYTYKYSELPSNTYCCMLACLLAIVTSWAELCMLKLCLQHRVHLQVVFCWVAKKYLLLIVFCSLASNWDNRPPCIAATKWFSQKPCSGNSSYCFVYETMSFESEPELCLSSVCLQNLAWCFCKCMVFCWIAEQYCLCFLLTCYSDWAWAAWLYNCVLLLISLALPPLHWPLS